MKVKVHPHRNLVKSGVTECVSVTPVSREGKAYYRGTVGLRGAKFVIHNSGVQRAQLEQVRNVHAWCVGDLALELSEQRTPEPAELEGFVQVTYHFNVGRFMTLEPEPRDVTDGVFPEALFVGASFYVKEA